MDSRSRLIWLHLSSSLNLGSKRKIYNYVKMLKRKRELYIQSVYYGFQLIQDMLCSASNISGYSHIQ